MIDETTQQFFITGITAENEQYVIDELEGSGFSNWWGLPEGTADYIYVSTTLDNQYMRMWNGDKMSVGLPMITAEEYLCEEVSK